MSAAPAGPFAVLAEKVRRKREASQLEAEKLHQLANNRRQRAEQPSAVEPPLLCPYCSHPVDPVSGCWIGRGLMAHDSCAWAINDGFFFAFDAEESETQSEHA